MLFPFQGRLSWIDGNPYSFANWNTYTNYPHVIEVLEDAPFLVNYLGMIQIERGVLNLEPRTKHNFCVAIWYHSNYIDHSSWVTVPCDGLPLFTAGIICEQNTSIRNQHKQNLNIRNASFEDDSLSNETHCQIHKSESITLYKSSISCPRSWTFIDGSCFRVLLTNDTSYRSSNCHMGYVLRLAESNSEFVKRHVFAYLEYLF